MAKEVVWTHAARNDLKEIYEFYCLSVEEQKAFSLIEEILSITERFYQQVIGSTRYISSKHRDIPYQKLVIRHFIIIFREEGEKIYINRVFDGRQDPKKVGL